MGIYYFITLQYIKEGVAIETYKLPGHIGELLKKRYDFPTDLAPHLEPADLLFVNGSRPVDGGEWYVCIICWRTLEVGVRLTM